MLNTGLTVVFGGASNYLAPALKKAVLSQGEQCDVAVNFDTHRILQRHRTCDFLATARLSCWYLSDCLFDCSESSGLTQSPNPLYLVWRPSRGTPVNICIYLIFPETRVIGSNICRW